MRISALTTAVLLLCGIDLVACDDSAPSKDGKVVASQGTAELPNWLDIRDSMDPALWLRSREVRHRVVSNDPEVIRLRRTLNQAVARFIEDERMIANRTAQLSDALAETNHPEQSVDIMTAMIDVADATPHRQIYSALCQHYLNLRKSGMDRSAALANLVESYRVQNNL
jgi:hypothetical protein